MDKPIIYEYDQELPNFYDAFVAQAHWPRRRALRRGSQPLFADPENGAFKQPRMARGRLVEGPRPARPARDDHHHGDEHGQPRLHHRLYLRARRAQRCGNTAARRTVRSGAHAGRDAFDARLRQVICRHGERRRRSAARGSGLEVRRLHGRQAVWGGEALGRREGARLPASCRCSRIRTLSRPGARGRRRSARPAGLHRQGGTYTEYSSVWSAYFRPLLAQAMVGEAPVDEVMQAGAQRWNELKEQFASR